MVYFTAHPFEYSPPRQYSSIPFNGRISSLKGSLVKRRPSKKRAWSVGNLDAVAPVAKVSSPLERRS
jgi:hypothetical protein